MVGSDVSPPDSSTNDSSCDALRRIDDSYYQISPKKLRAATKGRALLLNHTIRYFLNQPPGCLKNFPDFHFDIDPKYRVPFFYHKLYYSYFTVREAEWTREFHELTAQWNQLQHHMKWHGILYAPTTDAGKQYWALGVQLARKRSNLEALAKQNSPDANAQLHLTKSIVALDKSLAELKRQQNQELERMECSATDTYLEDLTEVKRLRNLIIQKLHTFKILFANFAYFYDATETNGYYVFLDDMVKVVYKDDIEPHIVGMFTNKEKHAYIKHYPTNYFTEVRRMMDNTPLHACNLDSIQSSRRETKTEIAAFERQCSAWKSSEIVTRFAFLLEITVFSNYGLAIFRVKPGEMEYFDVAKQHFDNPDQVTIKCIMQFSPFWGRGEFIMLLIYSHEGNAPRATKSTANGISKLTILRQTKGDCLA